MKSAATKVLHTNDQHTSESLADALTWPDAVADSASLHLVQSLDLNLVRPDESLAGGITLVRAGAETLMPPAELLSDREMAALGLNIAAKRKNEIIWGKLAAKSSALLLAKNLEYPELEVSGNIFGNPSIQTPSGQLIGTSISHTKSLAVAVAFPLRHPMGIDIEQTSPNHREVISAEMTAQEIHSFENLKLPDALAFTLNWTIKEAYSKALGIGLSTPFRAMEVKKVDEIGFRYFESWLTNFTQFRVLSWVRGTHVLSVAVPYKTTLHWSRLRS